MHSIRNIYECLKFFYVNVHFHLYCATFPSSKPPKCQNHNFDKIMQKREIIFVFLPNTSHFMHLQSVRQKKGNIHNKTNKYRWHFRSKPHQTTSFIKYISLHFLMTTVSKFMNPIIMVIWNAAMFIFFQLFEDTSRSIWKYIYLNIAIY